MLRKHGRAFFGKLTQATQLIQPLVFVFVALINCVNLCGNVVANVSKYGRKFLMKKFWKKIT